ncbi:MAG: NAD(P)/FAD-dependent oxidoreductase [Candidatus Heimdallarchaeota archaeon]|nr:NAD(P)/FAD-dependent oxidoreductase [Candidatus Heimdallarchaeota archaeon]
MIQRPTPPDIVSDIVIIGAGVTGITASMILVENGIKVTLLGSPYESQLAKAGELFNTDLPSGTIGLKFMEDLIERAKTKGVNHYQTNCVKITESEKFEVLGKNRQKYVSKKILIATGAKQTKLNFEGEDKYSRKGISDCAVCDFPLYRNGPLAVIGNHKYTIRAANFLSQHTDTVYLLWLNPDITNSLIGKVKVYVNVSDISVDGDEFLKEIKFTSENQVHNLNIDALFVEGKPVPATDFLDEFSLEMDGKHIIINEKFETNRTNVWAAGDVTKHGGSYQLAYEAGQQVSNIILQSL